MEFANVDFTRTIYTCKASGMYISGFNKDTGMPTFETVNTDEFVAGKSNDIAFAFKMLKKQNKKVIRETVNIDIVKENVHSMTLEKFFNESEIVERGANGRVKK